MELKEFAEKNYKGKQPEWGFNGLGYVTYKRTYARPIGDRTEEWWETILRCTQWLKDSHIKMGVAMPEQYYEHLYDITFNLKASFSGRMLWQAGTQTVEDLGGASLCNCWAVVADCKEAFVNTMDYLMLGGGVGYNIQKEHVDKLPSVRQKVTVTQVEGDSADFVVPDSREGWVELLDRTLSAFLHTGESFTYSTHLVRPYGEPIKGFGGVASGPDPLITMIGKIVEILQAREGQKLRPLDALDIMNCLGECVVAGNVRRSAQIALGDVNDEEFLNAKRWDLRNTLAEQINPTEPWSVTDEEIRTHDFSGSYRDLRDKVVRYYNGSYTLPNHRAMSNNTAVCSNIDELPEHFWDGYEGKGEPYGLFNLDLIRQRGRLVDTHRSDPNAIATNPCFHPDTIVETIDGRVKIKDITEPTKVYSMDKDGKLVIKNASAAWKTKENAQTLTINIASGKSLTVTPDHKIFVDGVGWVEAQDLKVGDKLVQLCRARRGAAYSGVKLSTQPNREYIMEHRLIASSVYHIEDSDNVHHINGDTYDNCIDNLEVMSHSEHSRHTATFDNPQTHQKFDENGDFKYSGGTKPKTIIPMPEELRSNMKNNNSSRILSIEEGPVTDVYDITVEETHNLITNFIVAHNCAEISLAPSEGDGGAESCNLIEVFLNNIKDEEELTDVAKTMYIVAKTVAMLPYHQEATNKIVHANLRLGIGLTGIVMRPDLTEPSVLNNVYRALEVYDHEFSVGNGVNESIKLTTVKPSGTLSLLGGATAGVHPAYSKHYIRRIRMSADDSLVQKCKDAGYHVEYVKKFDGSIDAKTVIVEFPIETPDGVLLAKDTSAIKQMELHKHMQKYWADNQVSVTVYYRPEELEGIKQWLRENYDEDVKTISFLLHSEHGFDQAPYEEVDEATYIKKSSRIGSLELSEVEEKTLAESTECDSGGCPVR